MDFIVQSADRGFPLNRDEIMDYANSMVQEVEGKDCKLLGERWIEAFWDCHMDVLE